MSPHLYYGGRKRSRKVGGRSVGVPLRLLPLPRDKHLGIVVAVRVDNNRHGAGESASGGGTKQNRRVDFYAGPEFDSAVVNEGWPRTQKTEGRRNKRRDFQG